MWPSPCPLRGQREMAKRQPAGTGRRSPARFACSRAVARGSKVARHHYPKHTANLPGGWRRDDRTVRFMPAKHLPDPRSARGGKAPARGDGQALARALCLFAGGCAKFRGRGTLSFWSPNRRRADQRLTPAAAHVLAGRSGRSSRQCNPRRSVPARWLRGRGRYRFAIQGADAPARACRAGTDPRSRG